MDIINSISWDTLKDIVYDWNEAPQIYIIGAVIALWLLIRMCRRFRPIDILQTDTGRVSVSKRALLGVISNACMRVGSTYRPSVSVKEHRGNLHILVKIVLRAGEQLSSLSVRIQNAILIGLRENLGIENVGRIDVLMRSFKSEKDLPSANEATDSEEST
ncbi:MAG: hypothetical protein A2Y14_04575 [Verrucomicrobia bacterium GWF2_51_19]|nr:MAG: hypothetical protein A2Y14_04575 [Verrucomicrobia bacterium GWF2_51_19]HCJ12523.1 hypothetical protein [Opitutae bacterium]